MIKKSRFRKPKISGRVNVSAYTINTITLVELKHTRQVLHYYSVVGYSQLSMVTDYCIHLGYHRDYSEGRGS